MQLSLIEQFPEVKKSVFLDVFAKMTVDPRTQRPTLKTLEGQGIPAELKIRCKNIAISRFPEGTVYKLDIRLVDVKDKKPYFSAVRNNSIQRALEFFDYNLKIQKGQPIRPKPRGKVFSIRQQA
jgi:hypothetical protein